MENLDLKQMSAMVDIIAEEKGLPKETVLDVIEQAIAAAWRLVSLQPCFHYLRGWLLGA